MSITNKALAMITPNEEGGYSLDVNYSDGSKTVPTPMLFNTVSVPFTSMGAPTEHKLVLMYSTPKSFIDDVCLYEGTIGGGTIDITFLAGSGLVAAKLSGAITGGPNESVKISEMINWAGRTGGIWGGCIIG
jgi:hypothetical protein